ncbi:unnamed protein product [Closterium sp. NIES-64]|nr:unnamed protein product [Closterium sp. NIES-64]CAI5991588.1 unnamed protein product [Closterium sp. NIES-65]
MGWKPAQTAIRAWKILRGDKVMVMAGKDRGQTGTVTAVLKDKNRVVVEGLNLAKKHVKKAADSPGGVITVEAPIHLSNLSLLDPETGAPCRVAIRYTEEGAKVRVAAGRSASGAVIPRPEILKNRRTPLPTEAGPRDTSPEAAHAVTYDYQSGEGGLPPLVWRNERWEVDTAKWHARIAAAAKMRGSAGIRGAAAKAVGGAGHISKGVESHKIAAAAKMRGSGGTQVLLAKLWRGKAWFHGSGGGDSGQGQNDRWEVDSEGCVLG